MTRLVLIVSLLLASSAPAQLKNFAVVGDSKSLFWSWDDGADWITVLSDTATDYGLVTSSGTWGGNGQPTFSISGWETHDARDNVNAWLAKTMSGTPDYILCNLGVNDYAQSKTYDSVRVSWEYVVEAFHAKWPNAVIFLMRVWGWEGSAASWPPNLAIDYIVDTYSYVYAGPDEGVWLRGSDEGATMTYDAIHYSEAGQAECAVQWRNILTAYEANLDRGYYMRWRK
jgi:hypothetical protein